MSVWQVLSRIFSWCLDKDSGKRVKAGIYRCYYEWDYWLIIDSDSSKYKAWGYGDIEVE